MANCTRPRPHQHPNAHTRTRSPITLVAIGLALTSACAVNARATAPSTATTVTAGNVSSAGKRSAASEELSKFRQDVLANVRSVTEPMLKSFSRERAEAVRGSVKACRATKPYQTCMKTGAEADCMIATHCPYDGGKEQRLLAEAAREVESRYERVRREFHSRLSGKRRRFSIGTMNKLVSRYNEANQRVLGPLAPAIQGMVSKCAQELATEERPTATTTACVYDRLEKAFANAANDLERFGAELKSYSETELRQRIEGYSE